MLTVKCIPCNPLQENTYIVSDSQTGEAAIIDCGAFYEDEWRAIENYIREGGLHPTHLLCTHGHFDHVMGCGFAEAAYGLRPEIHGDDVFLLDAAAEQMEEMMGMRLPQPIPKPERLLNDGDVIMLGDTRFQVLHTPGHSPGGLVFHAPEQQVAFTGDTLFRMSVGRTDLHRGSWSQLMLSLHNVVGQLPPDTVVWPGHGPQTTIGRELRTNPYLH